MGSLGLVLEFSPYLNVFEASRDFKKLIEDVVRFDEISVSSNGLYELKRGWSCSCC